MLAETVIHISSKSDKKKLVDFAIEWIRVKRQLKNYQSKGELDSISYLFLMRDIDNMLHEVTQRLLFVI